MSDYLYKDRSQSQVVRPGALPCCLSPQHSQSLSRHLKIIMSWATFQAPGGAAVLIITFAQRHLKSHNISAVFYP